MIWTAPLPHTWTQCPKCASILQVLPPQLEQADGWVQCANCQQTFLALSCAVHPHSSAPQPFAETHRASPNSNAPTDLDAQKRPVESQVMAAPLPFDGSELKPQLSEPGLAWSAPDSRWLRHDPLQASTPSSFTIKPELIALGHESSPSLELNHTRPNGSSKFAGAMLLAVAFLVLMGLLAWLTFQYRNVLASWAPQSRPGLVQMCEVLSCQIDWPVDLSALSIEMSAFEHDTNNPNMYTLSLKLKNSNSYTVAAPRVRLQLMNDKDQILLTQSLPLSQASEPRVVHPGALNPWIIALNLSELGTQVPNGYRLELESPP